MAKTSDRKLLEGLVSKYGKKMLSGMLNEELGTPAFKDMPSKDVNKSFRPTDVSIDYIWDILNTKKVKDILAKYGVKMKRGRKSYGSGIRGDEEIALYILEHGKNIDGNDMQMRMQKAVNELDRNTEIYFECRWAGNVGIYADKITYDRIFYPVSYNGMKKSYDWEISELKREVDAAARTYGENNIKGIILLFTNPYMFRIKNYESKTKKKVEDFTDYICKEATKLGRMWSNDPKFKVELKHGKRDIDKHDYDAFVLSPSREFFTVNQNKFGDVYISAHPAFGADYGWDTDLDNLEKFNEDLYKIMYYLMH